jgi:hypothetical protein
MTAKPSVWTVLRREPLMHFLLIGAVLFAIDALRQDDGDEAPRRIVVTDLLREELARDWESTRDGPPSAEELDRLAEAWIDEEVLYREGLARGLDRDDPSVRGRVASKMAFVLRSQVVVPEPTDAELRAWFDAHAERFAEDVRVDFTHVFVAGSGEEAERRAEELLALVSSGATPGGLGDRFSGGRRYRGREIADLARAFGDEFVQGMEAQPIGAWQLRRSRHGTHVVRIDARVDARTADFETARGEAREAVIGARRDAELAARLRALRERWTVERDP